MKTKLMEIVRHENGWKGTWYKTGERHFVRQDEHWPAVVMQRWRALDVSGGINEGDCREVRGPLAWLKCALRSLRPNTSSAATLSLIPQHNTGLESENPEGNQHRSADYGCGESA